MLVQRVGSQGLYLNPPQHAAVWCLGKKTLVQAIDSLTERCHTRRCMERHGFECYRHGALALCAALDTRTGTILGSRVERHNSAAFAAFLESLLTSVRGKRATIRRTN